MTAIVRTVVETTAPPVGRRREWTRLVTLLDRARRGQGSFVLLTGEPGAGKSYLARRLADEARHGDVWVFTGHCLESEGRTPYAPYVEILEAALRTFPDPEIFLRACGESADAVVRLVPRLGSSRGETPDHPNLPAEQDLEYTLRLLANLIEPAASFAPLLLVIEDLQWADAPTVGVLQRLARQLRRLPVLLVGTYRESEIGPTHPLAGLLDELRRLEQVERVPLASFRPADVEDLLAELGHSAPAPELVETMHRRTDGNPFFVVELYRHLQESHALDPQGRLRRTDELDIPVSVKLAIGRRLERLAPATIEVLQAAAVAAGQFSPAVVREALDLDHETVLTALEEAEAAHLLRPRADAPDIGHVFTHELVRQTLLSRLSLPARQRLHLRVAKALEELYGEASEEVAALAHHFFAAGELADAPTRIRWLKAAGQQALTVAAYQDAMRHFERALLVRGARVSDPDLYFGLGLSHRAQGDWPAALRSWERALTESDEGGDHSGTAWMAAVAAQQLAWEGRWVDSVTFTERGLKAVGPEDPWIRARLLGLMGVIHSVSGDPAAAEAVYSEAVDLVGDYSAEGLEGFIGLCKTIHHFCYLEHAQAVETGLRAAEQLRRSNELWELAGLYPFVHWSLVLLGRFAEAERLAAEAEPLCRRLDHVVALGLLDRGRAQARFRVQPELEAGRAQTYAELGSLRERRISFLLADRLEWLGVLEFLCGDWDAALDRFQEAAAEEPPGALGGDWSLMAVIRAYRGEQGELLRLLDSRAPALPDVGARPTRDVWRVVWAAAEALHVAGERERSAALHPLVLQSMRSGQIFTFYTQRLLSLLAALTALDAGLIDDARRFFDEALRIADELPVAVERAEVRRHYGRALLEHWPEDREDGLAMIEEAVDIYAHLGMPRHAELAAEMLATAAAPSAPASTEEARRPAATCTLRRSGQAWTLEREGAAHHLPHSPGVALLVELLRRPSSPVHVLDLLTVVDGNPLGAIGAAEARELGLNVPEDGAGAAPDRQAISAYRARLEELAQEIRESEAAHDPGRTSQLKAEFDFIAETVERSLGLGGRERPSGSAQERARTRVAKALSRTLKKVEEVDPPLGRHLRQSVSTGTYCVYSPDPLLPVDWEV